MVSTMARISHPAEQAAAWLREARRVAVLSGAGMSTESGIPDFRSAAGIYSDDRNVNVFDLESFLENPRTFYRFAREFYPLVMRSQPNAAHRVLARWEHDRGKDVRIATQNIDDFHQRAGSTRVFPVHGDFRSSVCLGCGAITPTDQWVPVVMRGEVPRCGCGGVIKPNITFFGEMLPDQAWRDSVEAMARADLVFILGTSLQVYPAAALPDYAPPDARIVLVNRDPAPRDHIADIVLQGSLTDILISVDTLLDS